MWSVPPAFRGMRWSATHGSSARGPWPHNAQTVAAALTLAALGRSPEGSRFVADPPQCNAEALGRGLRRPRRAKDRRKYERRTRRTGERS
jgi:hypothetical protein